MFHLIVQEEKIKFNLHPHFKFLHETARSRIKRGRPNGDGKALPMQEIESKILQLILCMSNIKRSLTSSEGLMLVNDVINGTVTKDKLIEWKKTHKIYHSPGTDIASLGRSYWSSFLKRHAHQLRSKTFSQYAINRTNFTNYLNFFVMYEHIEKNIIEI